MKELAVVTNTLTKSNELLNKFTEFLDVAPLTVRSYTSGVKIFLSFMNSNGIKTPTRDDVIAFKKALTEAGRRPATVALYLAAVKRFFAWCEQSGFYSNITVGIKSPKMDKTHKKDALSGQQMKGILEGIQRNTIEGKRNYAMLALMANCGLRTVELARANIEDLRQVNGVTVLFIQGKGKSEKADFVKLSANVEKAIRAYLKARGQVDESEPLFVSHSRRNNGSRLTTRTISGAAKIAMVSAGYQSRRLTAHSFRHTAVTLALMAGQTLAEVQAFARHTSINTTMIYAHHVNRIKSMCESVIASQIF